MFLGIGTLTYTAFKTTFEGLSKRQRANSPETKVTFGVILVTRALST